METFNALAAQADELLSSLATYESMEFDEQPVSASTQLVGMVAASAFSSSSSSPVASSPLSSPTSLNRSINSLDYSNIQLYAGNVSTRLFEAETSTEDDLTALYNQLNASAPAEPVGNAKKRRRAFTIAQKQDAINLLDQVGSTSKVAKEVGVSRRCIQLWSKQREQLENPTIILTRRRLNGAGRRLRSHELEEELLRIFSKK